LDSLNGTDNPENLAIRETIMMMMMMMIIIIIISIFRKPGLGMWTGFIWFSIGTGGGLL
jgi:thiamine transporter ThiT